MSWIRSLSHAAVSACAIALLGCGPDETTTTAPLLNFTNGPGSPGPNIVRIEGAASRVVTTDPDDGLLAIHGQVSGLSECTDASTRVRVDIQIVRTPADAQAVNLLLAGRDNAVAIYDHGDVADLVPFDPDKFCPFITDNTPMYTGEVKYRLSQTGQGNLLFFWEGFLTRTADGAQVHYVEKQYAVPQPDGTVQFIIEDITVQAGAH